jgi:hypothetical protein
LISRRVIGLQLVRSRFFESASHGQHVLRDVIGIAISSEQPETVVELTEAPSEVTSVLVAFLGAVGFVLPVPHAAFGIELGVFQAFRGQESAAIKRTSIPFSSAFFRSQPRRLK